MQPEKIIQWFLPSSVRHNRSHPEFHQMYSLVSACLIGALTMSTIPLLLLHFGYGSNLWTYYLNVCTTLSTLLCLRYTGHWRVPNYISASIAYYIVYTWLKDTGLIYSSYMGMVHIYMICALLVDHKYGWLVIFTNVAFLVCIYQLTLDGLIQVQILSALGSPVYALLMHMVITIFMGSFLAVGLREQEHNRKRIKVLQDTQITFLDDAVRRRTEQLASMRQTIATDFHDQTGNMLAAISRQASMLELKLSGNPELTGFVYSIIENSNALYASSKDFLWTLNYDSDNPVTLFQYLTGHGQSFFNQFDISFSAETENNMASPGQLDPFASLNIIYIFKEAMTNIIKHTAADEVVMSVSLQQDTVVFMLRDNGHWKHSNPQTMHYGLNNMKKRASQSGLKYLLDHTPQGTTVSVRASLNHYFIENQ